MAEKKTAAEVYAEMKAKMAGKTEPGVNPPEAVQLAPENSFEPKTEENAEGETVEKVETTPAPTTPEAKAAASGRPERVKTANGSTSWKETALALEAYIDENHLSLQGEAPAPAAAGITTGLKDYSDSRLIEELERRGYGGQLHQTHTITVK